MTLLTFMGNHPVLTVILALIIGNTLIELVRVILNRSDDDDDEDEE